VTRVAYTAEGWGEGELWFDGPTLVWHELPRPRPTNDSPHRGGGRTRRPRQETVAAKPQRVGNGIAPKARRIVHTLQQYFAGDRVEFGDIALALEDATPFQQAVARTLRAVPYGSVVSYGDLARAAGYPNAQRAAGTFCAHNPFPLIVPCHRVVAANGLGPYGSLGADYKRRLLELEGVTL
jgi:methylated-DNA-[protein]-cysteine S-methyltransferase